MKISKTRLAKLIPLSILLFMNIAFYTLDAPGIGTGFQSAWSLHPLFGIAMSVVIGVPVLAYIYFIITDL